MKRIGFFIYGVAAHAGFLGVFAYMAAFINGVLVPRTVDGPADGASMWAAAAINLLLIALFGVQHSIMARPWFKSWWTRYVPSPIERSTYVMISNVLMIAMFYFWIPMPAVVWDIQNQSVRMVLWAICAAGWILVPAASLMINHFDLFGTRQVWLYLRGLEYTHLPFRTPMLYRHVRHPLYVGWLIAFWVCPTMTLGRMVFAGLMTAYILVALIFEERDLIRTFGSRYETYRKTVPALVPMPRPALPVAEANGSSTRFRISG